MGHLVQVKRVEESGKGRAYMFTKTLCSNGRNQMLSRGSMYSIALPMVVGVVGTTTSTNEPTSSSLRPAMQFI